MEFSRQEYWSGLPFPFPGDLPDPRTELSSLASPSLAVRLPLSHLVLLLVQSQVMSSSLRPRGLQHTRLPVLHYLLQLLKLMFIESVMPSNHLILCHRFYSRLQSFPASGSFPMSQLCASGGQSTGASASASILPNEYSGLISFRIDWFDLAVRGTLKRLLQQHHSSKASILQHSAFFMVQLSHL